ncbi:unnamed protein product [Acanthoscelides obtectus]|nr:unnamed protein product [Acanthoscelides obtectus]CAK1639972.1 Testis-expressed protein 10 [Acanthoscelides obtectus]
MKIHSNELISQHLAQIIVSISSLMQDKEQKVRKAAAKAVHVILEVTPEDKLQPFYNCFLTNLKCAMTNIDRNIQEGSLTFLDCFLKQKSELICSYRDSILPEVFSLFSKLQSSSGLDRKLTLNLGSKMTSVTWRINIMSRLLQLLPKVDEGDMSGDANGNHNLYEATKSHIFPIYKYEFGRGLAATADCFGIHHNDAEANNALNFQIMSFVPLLYQTFIEVLPEKKSSKSSDEYTALSEEAAAVLTCVISTLYVLWKYYSKTEEYENLKEVLLKPEARRFLSHLLSNFPYCKSGSTMFKKSKSQIIPNMTTDDKCTKENLMIAYIYFSLATTCKLQKDMKSELQMVTSFVNRMLLTRKDLNKTEGKLLVEFLKLCFIDNTTKLKKFGIDLRTIIDNTIIFYTHSTTSEWVQRELFAILLHIANVPTLNKSAQYNSFVMTLPSMLCKTKVSDVTVDSLLQFSKFGHESFQQAFTKRFQKILGNLRSLVINVTKPSLINTEESVKRKIVYIFYFFKTLDPILEDINKFCDVEPTCIYSCYFREMLNIRSGLPSRD